MKSYMLIDAEGVARVPYICQSDEDARIAAQANGLTAVEADPSVQIGLSRYVAGQWADHVPPKPDDTESVAHEWNAEQRRWVATETVAGAKARRHAEVNTQRDQAFGQRAMHGSIPYRITSDRHNLESILTTRAAAGIPPAMTTQWRADDNTLHDLTGDQLAAFAVTMMLRGEAIYQHSWALKAAIDAAESIEDVQAVDITAGWPA